MNPITLQQIIETTTGTLLTTPANASVAMISHDTRTITPGSLYVAIRGETHDGHAFCAAAIKAGATALLVDTLPPGDLGSVHVIRVADTRKAFGQLAHCVRRAFKGKVIAVAGSNGKTSTKKLIDAALRGQLRGSISPKSFNNDIGVPLTIFPADAQQDYIVLELGTNHPGEIRTLTHMSQPDIAVITNIGAEHLEHLGDLAGVRRENASILEGMTPYGTIIVNGDDAELVRAVAKYPGKRMTFGFGTHNTFFATNVQCDHTGTRYKLNGAEPVFVPLLGRHAAANALAAVAVAKVMALSYEEIIASLASATGADMRLQRSEIGGVTLLNDAYNANPNSMRAGLQTLVDLPTAGRRIAILGDMFELGETSDPYHREIGVLAAECKLDALYCIGDRSKLMADASREAGNVPVTHFATAADAAKQIPSQLRSGDLVLLKASRSMHLEAVANAIESAHTPRKAAG